MNFIKTTLLTILLSVSTAYCIEEQNRELQPKATEDLGLPNEMWAQILEHVYLFSIITKK